MEILGTRTRVGVLEEDDDLNYRFVLDRNYAIDPSRPILAQRVEDVGVDGLQNFGHIPLWFHHLLPPEGGAVRRWVERELGIPYDAQGFDVLSYLGDRLPGAVAVRGTTGRFSIGDVENVPVREHATSHVVALAGQFPKLSATAVEERLTLPLDGQSGDLIAKPATKEYPHLPRVEWATMEWARASGLDVPETFLLPFKDIEKSGIPDISSDGKVFAIKRFDRSPSGRIHMEDFAQVLDRTNDKIHGEASEVLGRILAAVSQEGVTELIRRLVFCVLAGNGDAHLKNWSLLYRTPRHASLSPAYDLVSTILLLPNQALSLSVGGQQDFYEITRDSFAPLLAMVGADRSTVSEAVSAVSSAWRDACDGFSTAERAVINAHLAKIRLR